MTTLLRYGIAILFISSLTSCAELTGYSHNKHTDSNSTQGSLPDNEYYNENMPATSPDETYYNGPDAPVTQGSYYNPEASPSSSSQMSGNTAAPTSSSEPPSKIPSKAPAQGVIPVGRSLQKTKGPFGGESSKPSVPAEKNKTNNGVSSLPDAN